MTSLDAIRAAANKPRATVTAECVGCGAQREIEAGEVAANDVPMCHLCGMPMMAKMATLHVPKGYKP